MGSLNTLFSYEGTQTKRRKVEKRWMNKKQIYKWYDMAIKYKHGLVFYYSLFLFLFAFFVFKFIKFVEIWCQTNNTNNNNKKKNKNKKRIAFVFRFNAFNTKIFDC